MDVVTRFVDPIDAAQRCRPWIAFPVAVVKKLGDDGGGNLASMLAFYAFLAVFPIAARPDYRARLRPVERERVTDTDP